MKLQTPTWKSAWFDHHLSERFLKEWSRMEQGPLREIESTSIWMDQIVIELGQLAQSMIHLEQSRSHASHLRLALERSLKLAVLAARLSGALEASYRENSTNAVEFLMAENGAKGKLPPGVLVDVPPTAELPDIIHAPDPVARPAPAASTAMVPRGEPPAEPVAAQPPRTLPYAGLLRDPRLMAPGPAPRRVSPEQERLVVATVPRQLETEQHLPERPMHQTIKSLSDRGLSLDEIELVTGQSRVTIETVLSSH